MMSTIKCQTVFATATLVALSIHAALAGVDVKVVSDKAFDFKTVRTWEWNAEKPGEIMMARTPDDDPEAMRQRAEPVIFDAVATEFSRRGVQRASSAPDVVVTYYLLLTTTMSAQTVGQFLPPTTEWGLPFFAPATQSLKVMNQGSMVLDLSAQGKVVWRGVAEARIKIGIEEKKREAVIREAVRDLLRRYPPKS